MSVQLGGHKAVIHGDRRLVALTKHIALKLQLAVGFPRGAWLGGSAFACLLAGWLAFVLVCPFGRLLACLFCLFVCLYEHNMPKRPAFYPYPEPQKAERTGRAGPSKSALWQLGWHFPCVSNVAEASIRVFASRCLQLRRHLQTVGPRASGQ